MAVEMHLLIINFTQILAKGQYLQKYIIATVTQ